MKLFEYLIIEEDMRQQQDDDRLKMEGLIQAIIHNIETVNSYNQDEKVKKIMSDLTIQLKEALNYFIKLD
jgi:hypothetical protein